LSSTFVIHGALATGGLPDDLSDEEFQWRGLTNGRRWG
jgi:hypothetical protein